MATKLDKKIFIKVIMMKNINFLKEILMSDCEYWIVAKKNIYRNKLKWEEGEDDIIFISIPHTIKRPKKYEEITLKDIDELNIVEIDNIYLTSNYSPFQVNFTLYNVYDGFPIENYNSDILIKILEILELESRNLFDYKKVIMRQK
jgi:hypothetical protein